MKRSAETAVLKNVQPDDANISSKATQRERERGGEREREFTVIERKLTGLTDVFEKCKGKEVEGKLRTV